MFNYPSGLQMESSLKIYSVCIYNIYAYITLLQMYFFQYKAADNMRYAQN